MNALLKSSSGFSSHPMDSCLLADRKVFLDSEITTQTALNFTKSVMHLLKEDDHKPIDVLINSEGGELNAGMLIYDVMQGCPVIIRTYVIGRAYSMAAFLFISGTGGRYMLPHSEIMLHEPILGNRIQGTVATIRSASEALMEARKHMNELISKHTGRSTEDIEKETSYDHFFLPEEAVSFGAADKIISFDQILGGVK